MLAAAFWAFVGGFSLLIGALVGISRPFPARLIGLIMGFGPSTIARPSAASRSTARRS